MDIPPLTGTSTNAPRGFKEWLGDLADHGMGVGFRPAVASELRVLAGTGIGGVILCSGTRAIPYVDWIQDGMSMSSRLILHTESEETAELIGPHYSTDIRIATHSQDLSLFLSDIEEHRFDLVLIDAEEVAEDAARAVVDRITDQGLLLGVGEPATLDDLTQRLEDSHFCCWIGGSSNCAAWSRKGLQHRASRRGGRRRRDRIS